MWHAGLPPILCAGLIRNFPIPSCMPYTREDLEKETRPKAFSRFSSVEREQISRLEGAGEKGCAKMIESLLKRKSYVDLIGFLQREAEEIFERERKIVGEPAMREWEKKESQPIINC